MPGLWRPPWPQVGGVVGVVEYEQPAVTLAQRLPQGADGLGLLSMVGQAKAAGERDQLAGDGCGLLSGHPPDQVVVGGVAVGVLQGQLGLADPTQPVQRLRLNLHDRGRLAGVQALVELVEQVGAAGEVGIAQG
jgi:hypothetical protein